MNGRAIFAIVRKDLKVVRQNKGVVVPLLISFLVFFVVLPGLSALIPALVNGVGADASDIEELITRMPAGLRQELTGLNMSQKATVFFLVHMMAPMFLIIPLMAATTIAADSFAGEKERKTMEALLYTPTTDRELFAAKLLSAWLAAVAIALVGFVLYAVTANMAAWSHMGYIFFPNAMWLILIIWVVPAVAGLGISVMVLASARAQGFQDAYQIGGIVVLPMVALFYAQIAGVMYFNIVMVFLLGLGIWLLDGLLIWLGSRSFRRSRLLAA
jgi:ABC-2 type transport system permease protein